MNNRERAINTLKFRENAAAGRWISRGTKIRMVILAVCILAMLWVIYSNPEPAAIGAAGFFSGIAVEFVRRIFAQRRAIRDAWPFTELVTDWDKVNELAGIQPFNPRATNPNGPSERN